jgi:Glycosyltransferases involved in cell wall biogenesis
MQKLLTIVVPVYKVEEYINKCLDSLVVSPELMERMDVLIINDGTPDSSAEMSREYVNKYPGVFRQIDKENGGHGSVWNIGLKEAYGKYTKFLDSDDWLENLDILIQKLERTDADLVITPCITHNPGNERWKLEIKDMEFDRVYDADRFDWLGNRSHRNYIFHHCAVYKTEMFRQYLPLFLEKQPYDDIVLAAAPIIGAKTLVAWDLEVYHYLMDRVGQSISKSVQLRNVCAMIKAHQQVIEFVENHPVNSTDSTKYLFFQTKLPIFYSFGYKLLLDMLPYKEAQTYLKEWDLWTKERTPKMTSRWMRLYRALPFPLYWMCLKSAILISKICKRIKQ